MIIYGKQLFLYALEKHSTNIKHLYLSKDIDKKLFDKVRKLGITFERVDEKKAQGLAKGGNHQGFIFEYEDIPFAEFKEFKDKNLLVVLVGVTDVGNIGSIVRSCYSLGVDGIILSGIKSIPLDSVTRSSSGALFDMPIAIYENTLDLINELKHKNFNLFAAVANGENKIKKDGKMVLFLGSEGDGIPSKILNKIENRTTIKMARDFNSLNVAVACAILIDRIQNG
ncbi:MAG: 23S rRNA (guanosine(2251)-2'-O)-methyltransferase RlmB [Campylobacterales bacterium]|nr:23S rRNA (guanosine(2251)-2'-O)-methyltransferase RlmB [Campylobacterales bacterium]